MEKSNKKKKIPKIDRDRFIESIYHLVIYGNTARSFNDMLSSVADKINENERMIIRYSIQWNVMLMSISLIDELDKYLFMYKPSDKETKNRVDSYKYIIEPILNQLNKWIDMRKTIVDGFGSAPKKFGQSFDEESTKVNSILLEVNKRINEYNVRLNEEN